MSFWGWIISDVLSDFSQLYQGVYFLAMITSQVGILRGECWNVEHVTVINAIWFRKEANGGSRHVCVATISVKLNQQRFLHTEFPQIFVHGHSRVLQLPSRSHSVPVTVAELFWRNLYVPNLVCVSLSIMMKISRSFSLYCEGLNFI